MQRFKGLQQKGVISQQDTDHQSLQEHRAREELYNAQVVLARLKVAYSSNLLMAQSQVKTAQASLVRAAKLPFSSLPCKVIWKLWRKPVWTGPSCGLHSTARFCGS